MRFNFKAQKAGGEIYEGELGAEDKYALARELHASGETLISAHELGKSHTLNIHNFLNFYGRVGSHDKVLFARNLGSMIRAGLSVSRALGVLERQTRNAKLKRIITDLISRISSGETLSRALGMHEQVFSPLFISMVRAGEEGGNLGDSLQTIGEHLDRSYALERKIRGALMYPGIILTVMIAVGIIMFIFIVPQIAETFTELNVDLPRSTQLIIFISNVIQNHFIIGLAALGAAIVGIVAVVKSKRGKRFFDFLWLHLPVFSPLVKETIAARTGQTLSSLLSSGVDAVAALSITADTISNSYSKEILLAARETIERGEPISAIFRKHEDIYPPILAEMVAVGEETGKLSQMLKEIGVFFEGEVDQKTKNLSTFIEPVLMVIMGVAVGFFSIAMISPMYSLMNSL